MFKCVKNINYYELDIFFGFLFYNPRILFFGFLTFLFIIKDNNLFSCLFNNYTTCLFTQFAYIFSKLNVHIPNNRVIKCYTHLKLV